MQHALVSAVLAVPVLVTVVRDMSAGFALVPVAVVLAVQMSVVRVVDVVLVRHPVCPQSGPWVCACAACSWWRVVMVLTFEATGDGVGQAVTRKVRIRIFRSAWRPGTP